MNGPDPSAEGVQAPGFRRKARDCRAVGEAEREEILEGFASNSRKETSHRRVGPGILIMEHVLPYEMADLRHDLVRKTKSSQDSFGHGRRELLMAIKGRDAIGSQCSCPRFPDVVEKGREPKDEFPRRGVGGEEKMVEHIESMEPLLLNPATDGEFGKNEAEYAGLFHK